MTGTPVENAATKAVTDAMAKGGTTIEHIIKANTDALTQSSTATIAGAKELAAAYQALAVKNAEKLTASIQALAAVKNPVEFIELQQKLIKEGVESAVSDSQHIAELTAAVFTAAFEPMKKHAETLQNAVKN
jgi:phasin family protein